MSVQGIRFDSYGAMEDAPPGAWALEEGAKGIFYVCPCGCGVDGFLPFRGFADPPRPSWEWDGNRDAPTLSPSILRPKPPGCGWHGYLRAGVWESC